MKKNIALAFIVASFAMAIFLPSAHAVVFTDFISYGVGQSVSDGTTPIFSYSHDITDNIGGNLIGDIEISDATLTLTYSGITGSTSGELWRVVGLGDLQNGVGSTALPFGASPLADLAADGLFLVQFTEHSGGSDSFTLLTSTLSGNYRVLNDNTDPDPDPNTPVTPEPGTMTLMGLGLAGLGFARRFKK